MLQFLAAIKKPTEVAKFTLDRLCIVRISYHKSEVRHMILAPGRYELVSDTIAPGIMRSNFPVKITLFDDEMEAFAFKIMEDVEPSLQHIWDRKMIMGLRGTQGEYMAKFRLDAMRVLNREVMQIIPIDPDFTPTAKLCLGFCVDMFLMKKNEVVSA